MLTRILGVLRYASHSPALATLTSRIAAASRQGSVLGAGQSFAAGARAFGPLAAGALYDAGIALPYLIGGALALLAGLLVVDVKT